ncbi:MAG: prephenate dehydratase domain-containing protein, partial [Bacteroidota bacterium]
GTRGVAAIASELAAEHYGLEILAPAIETHQRNYTRFLIVVDQEEAADMNLKPNKASLCFNLAHKVGGLSQVLLVLSSHGMNLTKIQSLPVIGKEWEYFFHIDLTFDAYEQYKRALSAIDFQVEGLRILGEYERGSLNNGQ